MKWLCSLDDKAELEAFLSLWAPNVLQSAVAAGRKPSRAEVRQAMEAAFGKEAAEAFADVAYERGMEMLQTQYRLSPALEAIKEGRTLPGPNVVPAPAEEVSRLTGGETRATRNEGPLNEPRQVTREHLLHVSRSVRDRAMDLLWGDENLTIEPAIRLFKETGGFTVHPGVPGGDVVAAHGNARSGYLVSIPGSGMSVKGKKVTKTILRKVIEKNKDILHDPRVALGGWYDKATDTTWIELSTLVPTKKAATRLGREWNQVNVVDLPKLAKQDWDNAFIPTGGSGETPKDFTLQRSMLDKNGVKPMARAAYLPADRAEWTAGQRKLAIAEMLEARANAEGQPLVQKLIEDARRIREEVSRSASKFPGEQAAQALRDAAWMEARAGEIMSGADKANPPYDMEPVGGSRHDGNNLAADQSRIAAAVEKDGPAPEGPGPTRAEVLDRIFVNPKEAVKYLAEGIEAQLRADPNWKGWVPKQAEINALEKYLGEMIGWVADGQLGKPPKLPKALQGVWAARYVMDPVTLIGDIAARMRDPLVSVEMGAHHELAFDSAGAKLLQSGLPSVFAEVITMLAEKGIRISPKMRTRLDMTKPTEEYTKLVRAQETERAKQAAEQAPPGEPLILDARGQYRKPLVEELSDQLVVELPESLEFLQGGRLAAASMIGKFLVGKDGDTLLSSDASRWGSVNLWDFVRPGTQFSLRKALPKGLGEPMINLLREQGLKAQARRYTLENWMRQELYDLRKHLKTLTPHARNKLMKQIVEMKEGKLEIPQDMHPAASRALSAMHRLFSDYSQSLNALGVETRKDYFPHIFERIVQDYSTVDSRTSSRIKELKSRFFNPRKGDGGEFITDLHRVLDMYISSVERVITWQPVRDYWNGVKESTAKAGRPVPARVEGYMDKFFDVLEGRPGSLDRFMNFTVGAIADTTYGFNKRLVKAITLGRHDLAPPGPRAGVNFMRGWLSANYLGALGGSLVSPLKNLTANVQSVATIGPGNWYWGLRNMFLRDPATGEYRLNPLVERMGVWEAQVAQDVKREQSEFRGRVAEMGRDVSDVMMALFDASELQLRATVGLGALRQYLTTRGRTAENATPEMLTEAIRAGRDAAARTQAEYSRHMGGIMFGSTTGKALFQFGRFGFHYLDLLQLMVRAGIPGKMGAKAREMLPSYARTDNQLMRTAQAVALMGGMLGLTSMLTGMNLHVSDVAGPAGGVPEVAKSAISTGASFAVEVFGSGDEREKAKTLQGVDEFLGSQTRDRNPWSALFASFGPLPEQLFSVADYVTSSGDPTRVEQAEAQLIRAMGTSFPGGLQLKRILRYAKERSAGMVASGVSGDRIFPKYGRLSEEDAMRRLVGFQPADLSEEYREINHLTQDKTLYTTLANRAKRTLFENLDKGMPRDEARLQWIGDWYAVLSQYGQYEPAKRTISRLDALMGEYEDERTKTRRQRREDQFPFKQGEE